MPMPPGKLKRSITAVRFLTTNTDEETKAQDEAATIMQSRARGRLNRKIMRQCSRNGIPQSQSAISLIQARWRGRSARRLVGKLMMVGRLPGQKRWTNVTGTMLPAVRFRRVAMRLGVLSISAFNKVAKDRAIDRATKAKALAISASMPHLTSGSAVGFLDRPSSRGRMLAVVQRRERNAGLAEYRWQRDALRTSQQRRTPLTKKNLAALQAPPVAVAALNMPPMSPPQPRAPLAATQGLTLPALAHRRRVAQRPVSVWAPVSPPRLKTPLIAQTRLHDLPSSQLGSAAKRYGQRAEIVLPLMHTA